jgi:galactonate dehydratase
MAAARGISTAPHGPFGPVTTAASVQAMAAHPDFLILEYAWGEAPWRADLILPSETIVNGRIAVSQAPGLGVELNPEMLAAHGLES